MTVKGVLRWVRADRYDIRRHVLTTLFTAIAILTTTPARPDVFLGVRAGAMTVDRPGAEHPTNLALSLSVDLDVMLIDLGINAELTRTVEDGETRNGGDINVETEALYLTVKSPGTIYLKIRAGLINEEVTAGNDSNSESGVSLGGGLGISVGKVRIELDYTTGSEDTEFQSIGLQFLLAS